MQTVKVNTVTKVEEKKHPNPDPNRNCFGQNLFLNKQ